MTPFVIGSRDDVAGFALAGVAGAQCASREEIEAALERAGGDAIVIFSASLAPLVPPRLGVLHVVLPER